MFINTLPLRVEIGQASVQASVRQVHEKLAQLLHHEHASLALAQRCSAVPAPTPLFTSLLNYRYAEPGDAQQAQGWEGIELLEGQERTNYPVTLSVDDLGEDFNLTAQTLASVGASRLCELMRVALQELAQALESEPHKAVHEIEVLTQEERRQALQDWNATQSDYPREQCIHELFEAQAKRTPEAIAVICEECEVSYGELNAHANRLAHHLRKMGVKPDDRVAICVQRSVEMVIGLLAILKAGGGYVPLDPDYPPERLGYMLADSAPVAVLCDATGQEALTAHAVDIPLIALTDQMQWADEPESNLDRTATSLKIGRASCRERVSVRV
jgi:non-ribosomal peptide synthetase component F